MKYVGLTLLGLATLLCVSALAESCPPVVFRYAPVYHAPVYHAPVVVAEPVVIAQFVPVAVAVPSYTASFGGPQTAGPDLGRLTQELQALRLQLQQLRGTAPGSAPDAPAAAPIAAGLLESRCAACHTAGKAPKGGVVLFDAAGKRAPLSPEVTGDALQAVIGGSMPKGARLGSDERLKVLAELTGAGPK